jgi:hypothetical protein
MSRRAGRRRQPFCFFSIASAGLAPIVTPASTSFANSASSLLAVVVVRSLGGIQLQTGEAIGILLPGHIILEADRPQLRLPCGSLGEQRSIVSRFTGSAHVLT